MKIIVLGSKGMLGTDLVQALSETQHTTISFSHSNVDIAKSDDTERIKKENPDIIINCAAYTNVDLAETEKEKCYAANVAGIRNLAAACKSTGAVLITFSTDYIFDGEKEAYDEDDSKNPINYYGKTKAEGEEVITRHLDKYYILRTSWLFGKNGRNFVSTIAKLCSEKPEIKVVNDQRGRPTYTKDLVKATLHIIENMEQYPPGIYHTTNRGACSWFEFAGEIGRLIHTSCRIMPCTTAEFPRPAKRPKFSVLNNNKLPEMRNWKDALYDYLKSDLRLT